MTAATKNDIRTYHVLHAPRGITVRARFGSPTAKPASYVVQRGDVFYLDKAVLDTYVDREGNTSPFLALLDDIPAQVRAFGMQVFARGPFPADEPLWDRETRDGRWVLARREASDRASMIISDSMRRDALAEVTEIFGPAPVPGVDLAGY